MLADDQRRRQRAAQNAGARRQAFQIAHLGIGTLVEIGAAGQFHQQIGQRPAPALHPRRQHLHHQRVAVAVHHQAGQAVGFAVHQPHAVGDLGQFLAQADGARQTRPQEGLVDGLVFPISPHPSQNLRFGAIRGQRQESPVGIAHRHGFAGLRLALDALDGAGKNPGVAVLQGFLPTGIEDE